MTDQQQDIQVSEPMKALVDKLAHMVDLDPEDWEERDEHRRNLFTDIAALESDARLWRALERLERDGLLSALFTTSAKYEATLRQGVSLLLARDPTLASPPDQRKGDA